jgi:hypothetical protein
VVARIDYTSQTIVPVPPVLPTPAVTVVDVQERARRGKIRRLDVTFSGALNRRSARNPANYWLILPGPDEQIGTSDDRRIRIRVASYKRSINKVSLIPRRDVSARQAIALVISGSTTGSSVRDFAGRPIDGDRDGQPGGDDIAVLAPLVAAKTRPGP